MSDLNLKGADLKKIIGVAKKGPLAFGFNPGKSDDETFFGMHRIKAPKAMGKAAKDEGGGKKFSFGTAHVDGKTIFLTCERELPQMAKSLKRYLKSQKIMLNVEVLDGDGNTLESDSDDSSPDEQGDAGRAGDGGDDGGGGGDSGPSAEDAQIAALAAQWTATEARMTPVVASAASRAVVDPTKLRADWAVALERAGNQDYAGALGMATQVAQFIKNGGGAGHATPGAADQNIAKWELAKKKIESVVEQALARGAGDVAKIRAVWDFALGKAEATEHAAALKSLVPLSKLLAAAKAAPAGGPPEIEPGTVKARKGDLAQGKALLGALKDMLADIKQAFAIQPDGEAAIRTDIAAVQSAASGNDAAAGQVALARIKEAIDAAKALRLETIRRRDAALVSLQALEIDPTGINTTETAAHGAQRLIAQKVLDVEFPALAAIDRADAAIKLLSETVAKTKLRIAETARRKAAIEQAVKDVPDPDGANKAEIEALAQKRKATSDLISDDYPTDPALEKADQALAALKALLATTNARIEATKRRHAEVAALHKPLETEIARVLKLEGATSVAQKLLRKLAFEEEAFAKFMKAEDFDRAAALVPRIKAAVAALVAQEGEIKKSAKLRDDLLSEYKALTATLKAARAIYPVSPEFEADVKAFSLADYLVGAGMKNRDYASTFPQLDALKIAANKVLSRKAEFEAVIQKRKSAIQKWREAVAKKPGIDSFPALLPDVQTNCNAFYAALAACDAAFKAKDWAKCQAQAEEALRLSAAILARRADCLAETAKMEDGKRRYLAARALLEPSVGIDRIAPGFAKLMQDYVRVRDVTVKAFNTDKDFEKVLELVAELEALAAQLNARKAENAAATTHKDAAHAAYQKVSDLFDVARKVKVYTKDGLAAKTKFETTNQDFVDAYVAGADDTLAKMKVAVADAKALCALEVAELAERAQAKKEMDAALDAFRTVYATATALCDANRPALDALADELGEFVGVFNDMSSKQRYFEATDALAKATEVTKRIIAAKATVETETAKLKPVAEGRWTTALQADIQTVLAFDDKILPDLGKRLDQVFALNAKVPDQLAKKLWQGALDSLDVLEPLLRGLMAQKPLIDKQMADKAWLDSEYATDGPVLGIAKSIAAVDRAIKIKVDDFDALSGKYFEFKNAQDFTSARAIYPARLAAAKVLAALKVENDKTRAKYDAANAAWSAISADQKAARKFKALTPELSDLLDELGRTEAGFDNAYFGFDYDTAVARAPAVGVAAKAVIAAATAKVTVTDADGKTSQVDAYEKTKLDVDKAAGDAETALDAISANDLKSNKTSAEKVALLDALRGQKEELTDKQRELQRKIYASMEMDAEFVAQDDKRRADLTKAISEDKELMAAKDKWATMDVAKRIALLQKTLKTECAIYGMPVPTVQVFEEPMPGDLGSFNSGTNVIRINVHPSATFDDFHDTIDTIVHENAHNYQGYLVTRLDEGLLNPGDPEYKQALMFASNSVAQSYVDDEEDSDIYKKQPLEDHAWKTGDGVKYALIALPPEADDSKDTDKKSDGK